MILLSFDIEEFEMPREYGDPIPFDEQIKVSTEGTIKILDLLKKHSIKATFYTTANFAQHSKDIVSRIVNEGHELASHGYFHDRFEVPHLKQSKDLLETMSGAKVRGYRMARMADIKESDVFEAGYQYNSSINPTYLPGRYNKLSEPRTIFEREKIWQVPASVTPWFRIPLFWISFHNLPLSIYLFLTNKTLKKDGYLNIYFHPWEFMPIGPKKRYNFPFYVTRNTNYKMVKRLEKFILWAKKKGYEFGTTYNYLDTVNKVFK